MTSDKENAAKDTAHRVVEGAAKAGDEARSYAARAGEAAKDLYDDAQDRVRNAADHIPERASDAIAAGQRAYHHGSDAVGRQVAKQPIEALLLAGAIGYLVGWATNRS